MANTLEWILKIKDEISAPIQGMIKNVGVFDKKVSDSSNSFDKVGKSIEDLEEDLRRLKEAKKKAFRTDHVRKYNLLIEETESKLKKLGNLPPKKHQQNWAAVSLALNQTHEIISKISESIAFTSEIKELENNVKLYTGSSGKELDKLTGKAYKLSEVYGESSDEIAKAANAMTKQMGGSFEDNLALIEQGFKKGANLNRDFLEQLTEYSPQLKQAGISQAEGIAIMAKASKDGVFSDKAVDAIKEAGFSLREMGEAQINALTGIGVKQSDLVGKSTFEMVQTIASAMKTADDQAKQFVIADIFRGAGEDAGLAFIEGLDTMNTDLDSLESVEKAGGLFKGFAADVKMGISNAVGDIAPMIEGMGQAGLAVTGLGQLLSALKVKTMLMTAKQWLLNIAMNANPIALTVAAILALIALVTLIIVKYNEWGAALSIILGPLGFIIGLIMSFKRHWDSIVQAFKSDGIVGGLKRIGLVIFDAILMPLQQVLELASKIPGVGKIANVGAKKIAEFRSKLDLITVKKEEKTEEKKETLKSEIITPIIPKELGFNNILVGKENGEEDQKKKNKKNKFGNLDLDKNNETNQNITKTAESIATGGKRQQIFNIHIDKVLETVNQHIAEGKENADEIVDEVLDQLTRRLHGTFRTLAQ